MAPQGRRQQFSILNLIKVLLTFLVVMVGWALFRIENLGDCWTFLTRLFAFDFTPTQTHSQFSILNSQFIVTLIAALCFAFVTLVPWGRKLQRWVYYTDYSPRQHLAVWTAAALLFFLCVGALAATDFSPFIYFRF